MVSGAFLHVFSHWQRLFWSLQGWLQILIVCTSCKTSCNVLCHSHDCPYLGAGSIFGEGWGRGGVWVVVCWHSGRGWAVQEIEFPDFRSPKVGISAIIPPNISPFLTVSNILAVSHTIKEFFTSFLMFLGLCLGLQQLWTNWSWHYQQSDCTQKNQLSNNRCDKRQYNVYKFTSLHVYSQDQVCTN